MTPPEQSSALSERPLAGAADAIESLRSELSYLRAVEQRARELLDSAPDAVVVANGEGRMVLVNAQTEKLFGYRREELLGQPIEMLIPERLRAGHVARRDGFMERPAVRPMGGSLDLTARHRDGREIPVEISLSPLHTNEGVLVSAAIRDITERREAREALRRAHDELEERVRERTAQLEEANRALQAEMADRQQAERALHQAQKMEAVGQLTGGVAHDFNNLLTVIMGNLQMLASHLGDDAFARELIQGALTATRRGADLNRTLLAFSRKQRLAPQPVDCNELIDAMAGMLSRTLGEQVRVALAPTPQLPPAMADPALLQTALLNLAVNARDAMPRGGTLTIETDARTLDEHYAELEGDVTPGRYVMLGVSDTGTGMSAEVAARACEPFFTTKETGKGSGLGLAMVHGFVKQSGGHVKIYSEPGMGTTVKIFLPEVAADAQAPALVMPVRAADQPRGGHEAVLVVEDEDEVRAMVARVLGGLGYRVHQAADARSALAVLEHEPGIRLLFTDVVLPGGTTGPEIAARALELRPGLRVLYTSGYTGNAMHQLESLGGGVHLLSKPYAIHDLAHTVRAVLDA